MCSWSRRDPTARPPIATSALATYSSAAIVLSVVPRVCKTDCHEIDVLAHSGGIQRRMPAHDSLRDTVGQRVEREPHSQVSFSHGVRETLVRKEPQARDCRFALTRGRKKPGSLPDGAGHRKKITTVGSITISSGSVQTSGRFGQGGKERGSESGNCKYNGVKICSIEEVSSYMSIDITEISDLYPSEPPLIL